MMRPKLMLRGSRPVRLGAGALLLAIPASAAALAAGQADAQSVIEISPDPAHLAFGGEVTVTGNASSSEAGRTLQLEFAPAGATSWRTMASASIRRDGGFRFVAPLTRSGLVRVVGAGGAPGPRALIGSGSGTAAPSASRQVSVAAGFSLRVRPRNVLGGQPVHVAGRLLPAVAGRQVRLVSRARGTWHTLAAARTGPRGGFDLHYSPGGTGRQWLRVQFAGDRLNAASWARAGELTSFRQSVASWYDDGGATACGFHAFYGVANKDLPCGTHVTFAYGGHTVTATVDDRGPYVGGREWDLNQNTAGALGFGGVDSVWASV